MPRTLPLALALLASLPLLSACAGRAGDGTAARPFRVVSDRTVTGFPFPESVGCDAGARVLYVSQFVSALRPADKDGKGRISKVSPTGEMIDAQFLPGPGDVLNKPKGIWVERNRLWVTDIDVVWVFDTGTRKGRRLPLPGANFANDPAVVGKALYVSDNRGDALYRVEPADFLDEKVEPKVTRVLSGKSINPNGVYPGRDGTVLMVGFKSADEPRGIHALGAGGDVKPLSKEIGQLDGVYQAADGTLLVTDWKSASLIAWRPSGEIQTLAGGFKGPADFGVMADGRRLLVVVPDLVKSELRLIQLEQ